MNHGFQRFDRITMMRKIDLNYPVLTPIRSLFDPSLMGTFQFLEENEPALLEKCCDLSIAPIV